MTSSATGEVPPSGSHGGDAGAVAQALGIDVSRMLDLSQSLNPVVPDVLPVLRRHLGSLRRYPDPRPATAALARAMGVDQSRLLLTNGGAEAIALVAAHLGGRVVEPEFSLHPRGGGPRWRSNPHNPTGLLAGADEQADVWDEAFYPLATGQWTRGDDAVVVGSLTKLFGLPGLRVGYVLVPAHRVSVVDACRERQPEWSVNALAACALPELLELAELASWAASVRRLRDRLVSVLHDHGLRPRPSDANWVLVDALGLRDRLAPHGVLVRDCASFGMPGTMRIAVPPSAGLERLADALASSGSGRGSEHVVPTRRGRP